MSRSAESKRLKVLAEQILHRNGHSCYLCEQIIEGDDFNKDHVFPESMGYAFVGNMMPTHQVCNLEKGDRLPTTQEIERACIAYENAGKIFDPRISGRKQNFSMKIMPMEFYIHNLKLAA